jgi:hypothetical protein
MALLTPPAPMTTEQLNAAIAAGEFKIKRLAPKRPRRADLIMTRIGGSSMMSSASSDHQTRWQ